MAAETQGQPLLRTFQKHVEDMRNLVLCKICIKPLYEPHILACGHTYCYSCLTSWFTGGTGEQRARQNMKCPDCRAAVVTQPSPNYVLRDLVHMFIGRTELLSEDETTEEHALAKAEEASQMLADRDGVGLFKGAFGKPRRAVQGFAHGGAAWDPSDGVLRCPECHWELEHGYCNQCDWSISDHEAFSDEEDSESDVSVRAIIRDRARRDHELGGFHFPEDDEGAESIITISSDIDEVFPVDHDLDTDDHSDAESDLPVAMGGRPRQHQRDIEAAERHLDRLYANDFHYADSEMGNMNPQTTSEISESESESESDEDEEEEDEEEDSSEMDDFIEDDTPTRIPHRIPLQYPFDGINNYPDSGDEASDHSRATSREPSQTPSSAPRATPSTNRSTSAESSEDESRRTPVPQNRPSRQRRVVADESDEEPILQISDDSDEGSEESDVTTIPAQATATRRSHLQGQRARRGQTSTTRRLAAPPRNIDRGGGSFSDGSGSHVPQPARLRRSTGRRGTAQNYLNL